MFIKVLLRFSVLTCLLVLLPACVTQEGQVFTSEASPEAALTRRVALARSYIGEQNWEDAKRNLKLAAEIDPDAPEVNEAFALVYQSTGEYELAEQHFRRALEQEPDFSRARNNYAAFLYQQQRFDDAEEQLEIVIQDTLYESRPRAYLNLGLCRLALENDSGARDALQRALTMDRTNTLALMELAHIEFRAEDWALSERYYDYYKSIVKRQPPRALWLGVRLAEKLNDPNAAASYGLALRNMYPDSAEFQAYEKAVQRGGF
ncbi:type IV pilus biogenesis/stability protein PilW [Halieaceae bacterium IMCC14734]|uniref:Type IV pilus biogenesis/stability protein PilW n=2 Tax=Candidatus Litorirhabdus singularis TaxID=2518993 RepID=A0ABT3THJ6_9GAMM|nr:type IV pilus biogenesis/stability protein PilW [Candidatus Litorirhabdus singularis]